MVAPREGGETLHVHAEQAREGVGLGLAEGGELGGGVLHRAVALAELDAGQAARTDGSGGGGEAVLAERLDEGGGACGRVGARVGEPNGIPLLERRDAAAREVGDGPRAGGGLEEAQHLDGERVVVGLEGAVSGVGDDVGAGRAAAAAAGGRGHVLLDGALLDEHVEVAADGGGGQVEVATQLGSGDRAVRGDHVQHPGARARLERRDVLAVLRCRAAAAQG